MWLFRRVAILSSAHHRLPHGSGQHNMSRQDRSLHVAGFGPLPCWTWWQNRAAPEAVFCTSGTPERKYVCSEGFILIRGIGVCYPGKALRQFLPRWFCCAVAWLHIFSHCSVLRMDENFSWALSGHQLWGVAHEEEHHLAWECWRTPLEMLAPMCKNSTLGVETLYNDNYE